ncbi:serine protease snake-like [Diprion similis]|uniref:serine protease snake-like n=1 Tax=Diprion similis TaxID=362088 RepID=UPI001EF7BF67|nr:serine protease snake-like [Diprion similis]
MRIRREAEEQESWNNFAWWGFRNVMQSNLPIRTLSLRGEKESMVVVLEKEEKLFPLGGFGVLDKRSDWTLVVHVSRSLFYGRAELFDVEDDSPGYFVPPLRDASRRVDGRSVRFLLGDYMRLFFKQCNYFLDGFMLNYRDVAKDRDRCRLKNRAFGVCTLLNNCAVVFQQLVDGKAPDSICGYAGFEPVVCCPNSRPKTTRPTPTVSRNPVGDGRGAIARQKCAEYANYTREIREALNGQKVRISVCAINYPKLILGGTRAERKEFPHMAAVGYDSGNGRIGWYCGGTLISENFVMTAAHCTYSSGWGAAKWVRVGDLNLERSDDGASPEDRRIAERIRHPEYQRPAQYHDIALLRLESRVPFNAWIRPACLHTSPTTGTEKAIATGWGHVEWFGDEGSSDLLKVTLPFVDQRTCNASWSTGGSLFQLPNGVVGEWTMCAGQSGRDTCQGDSGGPLVIYSSKDYYCMYDVVGVTSIGQLCGSVIPTIYTRVYHYVPWIESVVWGRG